MIRFFKLFSHGLPTQLFTICFEDAELLRQAVILPRAARTEQMLSAFSSLIAAFTVDRSRLVGEQMLLGSELNAADYAGQYNSAEEIGATRGEFYDEFNEVRRKNMESANQQTRVRYEVRVDGEEPDSALTTIEAVANALNFGARTITIEAQG